MCRFVRTVLIALSLLEAIPALGRVVKVVVESRQSPAFNGASHGKGGQYEVLSGRFFGELDPKAGANRIINDIGLAPRNARGRVEYSATFTLVKPIDASKASGVLIYQVPNRGNSPIKPMAPADEMEGGHILLSSGWQGDLAPQERLETIVVPVARNADGSSITGPVIMRLSNQPAKATTASLAQGLAGLRAEAPATLDTNKAILTRQYSDDGELTPIAASDWSFGDCTTTPFPGTPDGTRICLKQGFEPDALYQVVYTAKDPLILGIGLAATRDIVSFFRYAAKDDTEAPNPVAGLVKYGIGLGTSQSGNFIKTMIHLGFNADENGRIVWDGARPNIAARQNPINFRFALPGGAAGLYEPGSEGVLWWSDYKDEPRNRPAAGLLDRCRASKTCPKIMETFGSTEFWGLRMSPGLVGTKADADIPVPRDVRRYYFAGVTHGGGRGGFEVTTGGGRGGTGCLLAGNPNPTTESMRALEHALIDWVTKGVEPPASVYPQISKGDLVPPNRVAMGFSAIPGQPLPDNMINTFWNYDFGETFNYNDMSGYLSLQPPVIRGVIPQLVPRTNADGNETSGIQSVLLQAPLGSYLGWNVTASGYLKGRACGFSGGFIPFAGTKAERLASGDPRPSLEERYGTHDGYVTRVKAAAERLVRQGFLLRDDADRMIAQAEAGNVLK